MHIKEKMAYMLFQLECLKIDSSLLTTISIILGMIVKENLTMIANVYFVRHAEPDYSIRDDKARPLTQKGETAAQKRVNVFEDIG
jgi:hypothetical protein